MKGEYKIGLAVVLALITMFSLVFARDFGSGERQGVVVYTRKVSIPFKHTLVWMRFYYTDGIMNEDSFMRSYSGWHDFELGKLYKISYHRNWPSLYMTIDRMEIVEYE